MGTLAVSFALALFTSHYSLLLNEKDESEIPGVNAGGRSGSVGATCSYLALASLPAQFGEQICRMNRLGEDLELVSLRSCPFQQVGGRRLPGEQ